MKQTIFLLILLSSFSLLAENNNGWQVNQSSSAPLTFDSFLNKKSYEANDSATTNPLTSSKHLNQKEQMLALLEPYGEKGLIVYDAINQISTRCDKKGSELAVLFYLASSPNFELTRTELFNASDKKEKERIARSVMCPV